MSEIKSFCKPLDSIFLMDETVNVCEKLNDEKIKYVMVRSFSQCNAAKYYEPNNMKPYVHRDGTFGIHHEGMKVQGKMVANCKDIVLTQKIIDASLNFAITPVLEEVED